MGVEGGRFKRVVWGGRGVGEGTRDRTKDWSKPRKWNRQAVVPGETFVFCASLADVFDNAVPGEWRRDLFKLIAETPNLTWLLLTKRPQNIVKLYEEVVRFERMDEEPPSFYPWPRNAAIGCTIEDRPRLKVNAPALAAAAETLKPAFTFWSCEPLLEDLGDVRAVLPDWLITGGETDQGTHKARPANPYWYRRLRDQCAATGVPFHFKQNGEWVPVRELPPGLAFPEERSVGVNGEAMRRVGKDHDPCTLDGVRHLARPQV